MGHVRAVARQLIVSTASAIIEGRINVGMLRVYTWGSFRRTDKTFEAQKSGHAVAVDDAITFLMQFMPEARAQDLKLRAGGHKPDDDFAEANKRGLLEGPVESPSARRIIDRLVEDDED